MPLGRDKFLIKTFNSPLLLSLKTPLNCNSFSLSLSPFRSPYGGSVKNNSFLLKGIRSGIYKMEDRVYPVNNEIKLQGAAGSEVSIDLFGNFLKK